MNFFTSDEHYWHQRIIEYCKRPFRDQVDMNNAMIERNNAVVGKNDTVYHLGDFCLCRKHDVETVYNVVKQLHGTHILIMGNHDKLTPFEYIDAGFQSVHTSLLASVCGLPVALVHDPAVATVKRDLTFLVGHVHDMYTKCLNTVNVGVDVHNFMPVSEEKIVDLLKHATSA